MLSPKTFSRKKVTLYLAHSIELHNINMANSVGDKCKVEAKLITYVIFQTFGAPSIKFKREYTRKLNITKILYSALVELVFCQNIRGP